MVSTQWKSPALKNWTPAVVVCSAAAVAVAVMIGVVSAEGSGSPGSSQNTWHVPADFATIQEALDASVNGDTIIVAPGTYNEAINFFGKQVHLHSSDGPEVTTIDATGLNTSVVTCTNGENQNTILEGFTITGGSASAGGGITNSAASPTIVNCIIVGNAASNGGAVSNNNFSHPSFIDCVISDNSASFNGGGIRNVNFSSATVTGSTVSGNSAVSGGGIWNSGSTNCNSHVADTLFCENEPNHIFGTWHDQGGNQFLDECPEDDCPWDLTGDGQVDGADLGQLLASWGPCEDCDDCPPDFDGNCEVDGADLGQLLANWGDCP